MVGGKEFKDRRTGAALRSLKSALPGVGEEPASSQDGRAGCERREHFLGGLSLIHSYCETVKNIAVTNLFALVSERCQPRPAAAGPREELYAERVR